MTRIKHKIDGFLLLEALVALLIFSITAGLFWQGWNNVVNTADTALKRLETERAFLNTELLLSRDLVSTLPYNVSETITLLGRQTSEKTQDVVEITLQFQDANGRNFTRTMVVR